MKRLIALFSLITFFMQPAMAQDGGDRAVDDVRGSIEFIQTVSNETIAVWSDSNSLKKNVIRRFAPSLRRPPISNCLHKVCWVCTTAQSALSSAKST